MKIFHNDRFIKALLRQPTDQTPIWIMRQAGRYLPEYRALRAKARDFLTLCKTPELACEASLQPLARFKLDAAILFSDILTLPDAMGLGLYFVEGEGPKFQKKLEQTTDIYTLEKPDLSNLTYTFDAIQLVSKSLQGKVPLIGFSGSPWTLACYMLEGGASKTFITARGLVYQEPAALHHLLTLLCTSLIEYLTAQVEAGTDVLMLFDTWGGLLTPEHYAIFSFHYMKAIVQALKNQPQTAHVPIILFTKQGEAYLELMATAGCDALGLDWTTDLKKARQRVGHHVALQGNFDPALLFGTPEHIQEAVKQTLEAYGPGNGYIANLGHGIEPTTPPENVSVFVNAVQTYSRR